jgi:hypothetical protein
VVVVDDEKIDNGREEVDLILLLHEFETIDVFDETHYLIVDHHIRVVCWNLIGSKRPLTVSEDTTHLLFSFSFVTLLLSFLSIPSKRYFEQLGVCCCEKLCCVSLLLLFLHYFSILSATWR